MTKFKPARYRRDRGPAREQLEYLFRKQNGICHICGQPADLAVTSGPEAPNRFRVGSSYGTPGRVRPKVMAHRKCCDKRSRAIENSISIEERQVRSNAFPLSASELSDVIYYRGEGEQFAKNANNLDVRSAVTDDQS